MIIDGLVSAVTGKKASLNSEGRRIWLVFINQKDTAPVYALLQECNRKGITDDVYGIEAQGKKINAKQLGEDAQWFYVLKDKKLLKQLGVDKIPWILGLNNGEIVYSAVEMPSFPLSNRASQNTIKQSPRNEERKNNRSATLRFSPEDKTKKNNEPSSNRNLKKQLTLSARDISDRKNPKSSPQSKLQKSTSQKSQKDSPTSRKSPSPNKNNTVEEQKSPSPRNQRVSSFAKQLSSSVAKQKGSSLNEKINSSFKSQKSPSPRNQTVSSLAKQMGSSLTKQKGSSLNEKINSSLKNQKSPSPKNEKKSSPPPKNEKKSSPPPKNEKKNSPPPKNEQKNSLSPKNQKSPSLKNSRNILSKSIQDPKQELNQDKKGNKDILNKSPRTERSKSKASYEQIKRQGLLNKKPNEESLKNKRDQAEALKNNAKPQNLASRRRAQESPQQKGSPTFSKERSPPKPSQSYKASVKPRMSPIGVTSQEMSNIEPTYIENFANQNLEAELTTLKQKASNCESRIKDYQVKVGTLRERISEKDQEIETLQKLLEQKRVIAPSPIKDIFKIGKPPMFNHNIKSDDIDFWKMSEEGIDKDINFDELAYSKNLWIATIDKPLRQQRSTERTFLAKLNLEKQRQEHLKKPSPKRTKNEALPKVPEKLPPFKAIRR